MKNFIFIVEEAPEGEYNASDIGYSIFTEDDTIEELKINIKDTIKCHFENLEEITQILRLNMDNRRSIYPMPKETTIYLLSQPTSDKP